MLIKKVTANCFVTGWAKPRITQSPSEEERDRETDGNRLNNSRDVSAEKDVESNERVTDVRNKTSDPQQPQTAHSRSSDMRDRSSGRATDKTERGQRKDIGKDGPKSSAGADWREDNDEESVEWSQGDDAPYHGKTVGRRDKRMSFIFIYVYSIYSNFHCRDEFLCYLRFLCYGSLIISSC